MYFVVLSLTKFIDHKPEMAKKVIKHLALFDKVRKNSYKDIIPIDNII
jgi:hypothetical protein